MTTRSDATGWFHPALLIVLAVTAARLVLLAFNRTDLFVDESQYWLWGKELAFGYYSKPPLIGWVIGAVTSAAGSDAAFWVRSPAAVFHGATALVLGRIAAEVWGRAPAIWVAVVYATLPFVALGSLLISTDTIMAPFFAAALWGWLRLVRGGGWGFALLAGAMAGLAVMAKYAGVYVLVGMAAAAVLVPDARIRLRDGALILVAFGLVILPNVLWNLNHDLVTVSHTMDNVGWVKEAEPLSRLHPDRLAEFLGSQFAVFGPVLFGALLWRLWRPVGAEERMLLCVAVPVLIIVSVQALMEKAYANWAVGAYFAAVLIVVPPLLAQAPRLLRVSMGINGAIALALPLLTLVPGLSLGNGPLLQRYLGQAGLSAQIAAEAKAIGGLPIVADRRDVLADLFYRGIPAFAAPPRGRPQHYYELRHALPETEAGQVLWVSGTAPVCDGQPVAPHHSFDLSGGTYAGAGIAAFVIPAGCAHARP